MRGPGLAQDGQWKPVVIVGRHADGYGRIEILDQAGFHASAAVGDIVFTVTREYGPIGHPAGGPGLENPYREIFCCLCDHVDRAAIEHRKGDPESSKPDW